MYAHAEPPDMTTARPVRARPARFTRATPFSPLAVATALSLGLGLMSTPALAGGITHTPGGAVETLRFYTPGTDTITTDIGSPLVSGNACTTSGHVGDVCALGLSFNSLVAGTVSAYAVFDGALPLDQTPLVYQNLQQPSAGLGVSTPSAGSAPLSNDPAIDSKEGLTLFFAQPTTVVGFEFFNAQHQAFLPGSGAVIRVLVDELMVNLPVDQAGQLSLTGSEFTFLGGSSAYTLGAVKLAAPAVVPEPASLGLMGLGLGLVGVAASRSSAWRRQRQAHQA